MGLCTTPTAASASPGSSATAARTGSPPRCVPVSNSFTGLWVYAAVCLVTLPGAVPAWFAQCQVCARVMLFEGGSCSRCRICSRRVFSNAKPHRKAGPSMGWCFAPVRPAVQAGVFSEAFALAPMTSSMPRATDRSLVCYCVLFRRSLACMSGKSDPHTCSVHRAARPAATRSVHHSSMPLRELHVDKRSQQVRVHVH